MWHRFRIFANCNSLHRTRFNSILSSMNVPFVQHVIGLMCQSDIFRSLKPKDNKNNKRFYNLMVAANFGFCCLIKFVYALYTNTHPIWFTQPMIKYLKWTYTHRPMPVIDAPKLRWHSKPLNNGWHIILL